MVIELKKFPDFIARQMHISNLTPCSQTLPPGEGLAYRRSMDGRSAGFHLEELKVQASKPNSSLIYSSFWQKNNLKTFRKCKN